MTEEQKDQRKKRRLNKQKLKIEFNHSEKIMYFNSESGQDVFIMSVLGGKKNGHFIEIGSQHPIIINNTYILEHYFGWHGCMVEKDEKWRTMYDAHRNADYKIEDATKINYEVWFRKCQLPKIIDYLSLDLEVNNNSTIECLRRLPMQKYQFRAVTFEHDIYRTDSSHVRDESRKIFKDYGYELICPDVKNSGLPYEDWYAHPDLVDMNKVDQIRTNHSLEWSEILWKKEI